MSASASPTATEPRHRRVAVVATEGVSLASLHIFCDMIRLADTIMARRRATWEGKTDTPGSKLVGNLSLMVLSAHGEPVRSAYGELVNVDGSLADQIDLGLLIVPSQAPLRVDDFDQILTREAALPSLIADIWRDGTIVAAAGSSVAKFARAGILDGRAATIGWEFQEAFRRKFPAVKLDRSRQITEDSNIFCASSLGSEIVLACQLVSRLSANWVGEAMARLSLSDMSEPEPPGLIAPVDPAATSDIVVSKALLWIARNYSQPLRTGELAASLSVSERTLLRRFQRVMQVTPHAYMRKLRLDAAARTLRNTNMPVDNIAARIGYNDVDFFKQLFRRHYGTGPTDYRRQARAASKGNQLNS